MPLDFFSFFAKSQYLLVTTYLRNDAELFPPSFFFGVFAELRPGAKFGFFVVAISLEDFLVVFAHHFNALPFGHVHFILQVHDVVFTIRFSADLTNAN